ncbi:CAP domain-containing protein [Deinococcus taeanensis]|uniref:CAP domain-containing protein n=1 Tax=Deinococcus taeanensis TaxID=2737050 RepID=UPI001CDCAB54|nr:CAP domain-containing protein [Deinococcus taeanensis]UBV41642.1 CAP domain-containing protein [Deinococcus taeanensis]
MRKLQRTLGALATLLALGLPAAAQSSAESQLIVRLNQVRAQGVTCPGSGHRPSAGPLTYTPALAAAARLQAGYMGSTGRISHTGAGGSTPRIRAASTGVNAVSVTEIIYMGGTLNPESAIRWWLNSPVHCFWMNEGRYTHVGAAVIPGSRGTAYVMVLSSQPR